MTTVSAEHWDLLNGFRRHTDMLFARDVASHPDRLARYDQVVKAGRTALEHRGIDLDDEGQAYIVSSTIAWMVNFVGGLVVATCSDPHVLGHAAEALSWPAFTVRELTINVPLPEEAADGSDEG